MKTTARILVVILFIVSHFMGTALFVWSSAILYLVVTLLSIVSVIQFWKSEKLLKINIPEILLLLFVVYVCLNNVFNATFSGNGNLFNYLIFFLLYFVFVFLYNTDKEIGRFLFLGLFAGFVLELMVGYSQLFGVIPNSDSKFVVGGLFGNPGAFAGYLAIISSFLLAVVCFYKELFKSENFLLAILFSFFCAICLIILCDSRGAWVSICISIVFVLNQKYKFTNAFRNLLKSKISKIITSTFLLITVVVVCIALFHYKKESAEGRLLIWKISTDMIVEKPLFGNGSGSFGADYGKVQAAYFLTNTIPASQMQLADYVTCAYNEFLEIVIELGIIGLLLFVAILYFALAKQQNENSSKYYIAAKSSLIALLVLSMVSYPFNSTPIILLFVICLFIIFRIGQYRIVTISKHNKLLVCSWILAISALVYCGSRQVYGIYHFTNGYAKVLKNDFKNGINDYKKASPFLNNNGEFQFYYGAALYLKHDYQASVIHLQKAVSLHSDPHAFITLGNALQKLKQYNKAEQAYRVVTGITPAKMYPKYLLVKLYIEMQQTDKAIKTAKIIINAKEKVSTTAGIEMKTEMKILIDRYSKRNVKPLKIKL
ncbi:O-antigen ligase family protein [Flavobacterium piscis]|uniref:O-antigen ligase n=1 Tax=Flavobacterium piscis TaxID=1114874 RepID=A0ABU1Y8K5_9FLAO|nr:O-antigen ligase family protein [Flavobacterium piscis]MDR7210563.1 O-antigen ligase [Flavobacterium piscis]